jgi:phosphoglycolate phosphatase-like HAD superfamily hydrolase
MELSSYRVLFWDFDGVIKESINVKSSAFAKLFECYGSALMARILEHHLANGGMSRYEKFPIYTKWAGLSLSSSELEELSKRFSTLVFQGVIDAPWVPGAESFLRNNRFNQIFILISATPKNELIDIITCLNLFPCFRFIYGAPTKKHDAIAETFELLSVEKHDCLMIGDSKVDLEAANKNRIDFLLRRHNLNLSLFESFDGYTVEDFIGL